MSARPIRSAAVLGAGVMGSQIAAHLANAGLPVTLLDVRATTIWRKMAWIAREPSNQARFSRRTAVGSSRSATSARWPRSRQLIG